MPWIFVELFVFHLYNSP